MSLNVVLTHGWPTPQKTSETGPSPSCGYCCPLCHTGGRYPGKIIFNEPLEVNGHRRSVPGAPSIGTSRESQANFKDGAVWGCRKVQWVPGPRGQYSGKIRFVEKSGLQDEGLAMWLNVILTPPPRSLPRSQTSGTGPSANCGHCCPLLPTWGRYPGKIRFIEPHGVNSHRRPVPVTSG